MALHELCTVYTSSRTRSTKSCQKFVCSLGTKFVSSAENLYWDRKMAGKVDLKVVLLGKEYGGKTSLVERYIHNKFNSNAPYQSVS